MKELKFMALAMFVMTSFVFISCDDDDNYNPDQIFHEALTAKYPTASHVEWERKRTYNVAECYVDNRELDVWFNESAVWVMTETELFPNDVPTVVTAALAASEYSTWRVDDRDKLEYPVKDTVIVIEVEQGNREMDLYFSEAGELLEARDVSNSDDTHWPE